MSAKREQSSFRDPDGHVILADGKVYRAIMPRYINTWREVSAAAFFRELVQKRHIIPFTDIGRQEQISDTAATILDTQALPFISYPCEWTFEQLRSAALLTLKIQYEALRNGYTLKDASAYNVQFIDGAPVFIDLLSFEKHIDGAPWNGYGQFCRHFLAPLMIDPELARPLMLSHIDGIPLSDAAATLPFSARFSFFSYTHLFLHAKYEKKYRTSTTTSPRTVSSQSALALIEHLRSGIRKMKLKSSDTNWTDYYDTCSYSKEGYKAKEQLIDQHLATNAAKLCIDLGCNTGEFSKIASKYFSCVISCDHDSEVVRHLAQQKIKGILPLIIDLSNPTPAFGWNNEERQSFVSRASEADMVLALALVHHLRISLNIPVDAIASFFASFSKKLVIEFVPLSDPQVHKLTVSSKQTYTDYTLENFKSTFGQFYQMIGEHRIPDSDRWLFTFTRK